jgi:hypothetical protein
MVFVKGVSGNPGGRPKLKVNLRELAQENTMEALETLVQVMRTGKPGERLVAANAILDRAYGKPSQSIEMSSDRTTLVDLLVSMNKSPAVDGEPKADRADGGDSDADLHRAADPVH